MTMDKLLKQGTSTPKKHSVIQSSPAKTRGSQQASEQKKKKVGLPMPEVIAINKVEPQPLSNVASLFTAKQLTSKLQGV